ncbi:hypothetical protein Saso_76360 [Streptomyces asoensis]|uniref:Uncharacterized protein n=1 Tax=Streptomyces asoensis TaxID=249586 RepID=A0ABQ3SCX0_9ACTN|nr:hypothetical protein GCM10010496_65590 [Streptomyces asoensis]GHI65986.1 hypothetical protein Saso_76360 [Streptomyces asoensis]
MREGSHPGRVPVRLRRPAARGKRAANAHCSAALTAARAHDPGKDRFPASAAQSVLLPVPAVPVFSPFFPSSRRETRAVTFRVASHACAGHPAPVRPRAQRGAAA